MNNTRKIVWYVMFTILFAGCGKRAEFQLMDSTSSDISKKSEFFFPVLKLVDKFTQDSSSQKNTTVAQFQVYDASGVMVTDLDMSTLKVTENGTPVNNFQFSSSADKTGRKADIVIVIDSTSSMQPYIDQVKTQVSKFVDDLQKTNIKATLCLVHFGDTVRKRCSGFVEDNPVTVVNENVQAFLSALSGVNATGGADYPENQLGALEAASQTPWHRDAQHVAILVTDEAFHYAPDNLGDAPSAPTYKHALDSVMMAKMSVFAVAPSARGYNSAFDSMNSLPSSTGGMWFDFSKLISGAVKMDSVFASIVERLSVTYSVTYNPEETPGLQPTLPLANRTVTITAKDAAGTPYTIQIIGMSARYPNGVPILRSRFPLTNHRPDSNSMEVYVNGIAVPKDKFSVDSADLVFRSSPAANSEIEVNYSSLIVKDGLNIPQIDFTSNVVLSEILVTANGVSLKPMDYTFKIIDKFHYSIQIHEDLFDNESDPMGIRAAGGLAVKISPK